MALLLNHPGCQADVTCPAVYLLPIRAAFLLPFLTAYLLPFFMHFHCAAPLSPDSSHRAVFDCLCL